MAGNNVLLDTVIVAAYLNREQSIRDKIDTVNIHLSSITIGELFYGAYKSNKIASNIQRIREIESISTIIVCDAITGDYYGQIKQSLKRKGRPIPENDIWIAATALQHGLTMISRDAHFSEVDGLDLSTW